MKNSTVLILFLSLIVNITAAQNKASGGEAPNIKRTITHQCLSDNHRNEIFANINVNRKELIKKGILNTDSRVVTLFQWPIKNADENDEYASYGISNYVDHNAGTPNQLSDYQCGNKTYDTNNGYNHQGIDIYLWPFEWYKMENNHVSVVAAASGIIIGKEDGNFDQNCSFNNDSWNAVYIQHTDGSVAFYGHLKSGTLTNKLNGQFVNQGEFLGYIGSSGSSTGPHLHFEVFDALENLIDPYQGPCNGLNTESWWQNQKPYIEPQINTMYIHSAPPDFKTCPQTEDVNIVNQLEYNTTYNFATYYHDQQLGDLTTYKIVKPDGSLYNQWTHNSPDSYYSSYWYWNISFPNSQPAGEWTFEANYEGETYIRNFVLDQEVTDTNDEQLKQINAYPNPFKESITLTNCIKTDISISTISGKLVDIKSTPKGEDTLLDFSGLPNGIYIATFRYNNGIKNIKLYHY